MEFKANEIKTGTLLLASAIIFGLFMVAIFGVNFGKETNEYRVYLDYVGGITKGSLVKYRGLNVGQVAEILLPDEQHPQLGLKIKVEKDTPIRVDSRAYITSISLMAEQHVEISAGTPEAAILPPGSVIDSKEVLSFARMSETMGELSEQMQTLLTQVNQVFNDENQSHLASILDNVNSVVEEGRNPLIKSVNTLQLMAAQMEAISKNLSAMTDTSGGDMNKILANLEQTTSNAHLLMEDMNAAMGNLQSTMSANNRNISDIMENFQVVSQNFEEFSRMIKEQPWLLVRKAAPSPREIK